VTAHDFRSVELELAVCSVAADLWQYLTMFPDRFQTARLILRPISPADAAPIFDTYAQDPDVTRFLTWRPHRTLAETEAYVARCLATPARMFSWGDKTRRSGVPSICASRNPIGSAMVTYWHVGGGDKV
jgi:RimJ/RimL family protein N-acetyltransferase